MYKYHLIQNMISLAAGMLVLASTSLLATADQNDPRLDNLFAQLQAETEAEAGDRITGEIWAVWREHEDQSINSLLGQGVLLMSRGSLSEAVVIFSRIIEKDPQFAEGWNKRATAYYFMGELDKSAADVHETLLLEPRHFGAIAGMGLILMGTKRYEAAVTAFEKALEVNPHLPGPKKQIERLKAILRDDPV